MSKITNIMPMAGLGERFKNSIFNLPKPLIKIRKIPMFLQAAKSMPKSTLNIFVCHQKLEKKFKITKILKKEYLTKYKLILLKKNTNGQADTCLKAHKYLNENDKIFIHSCDSQIKFDRKRLKLMLNSSDAVILTTKPNKFHLSNVSSYGWVNIKNNKIKNITCKKKASLDPKKDKVIVGSFGFKNKKIFSQMIQNLINKNIKVNGEFYLDMAFSQAHHDKFNIKNLLVKSYSSWGTPKELNRWRRKIVKNK